MGAPGTTDGPWIADLHNAQRNGGRFYAAIWKPGDMVPIGAISLNVEGMPDAEGRANALQAAASPDLYDAALEARATIGDLQSALHDVLNLIDYMRCGDGSLPISGPQKLAEANTRLRGGRTDSLDTAIAKARGES